MTRLSIWLVTAKEMRAGKLFLIIPVTTSVEGRWVATMRWMPVARAFWARRSRMRAATGVPNRVMSSPIDAAKAIVVATADASHTRVAPGGWIETEWFYYRTRYDANRTLDAFAADMFQGGTSSELRTSATSRWYTRGRRCHSRHSSSVVLLPNQG